MGDDRSPSSPYFIGAYMRHLDTQLDRRMEGAWRALEAPASATKAPSKPILSVKSGMTNRPQAMTEGQLSIGRKQNAVGTKDRPSTARISGSILHPGPDAPAAGQSTTHPRGKRRVMQHMNDCIVPMPGGLGPAVGEQYNLQSVGHNASVLSFGPDGLGPGQRRLIRAYACNWKYYVLIISTLLKMLTQLDEDKEVEVRWEDQQQICEFGRINARRHELEDEISDLEKKEQDISDAEEGVMLVDESQEGATKLLIGETFVDVDSSKALEFIQQAQADDKAALERARAELKACLDRMAGLKKSLYARFGRNINLEE